jgi:transposase InsO family protein
VSTTDPDSTYDTKGGTPARLGYCDNYLVDNHSCVIVGVQATAAHMSHETVAAQDMITRFVQWQGREPAPVAADATYGNGEFLQWLLDRGITPYMRTRDSARRTNNPGYGPERFTYLPRATAIVVPPESN